MSTTKPASYLEEVQNSNRALVLRAVAASAGAQITRTALAKVTGLNRATITNIVADLIAFGLLREGASLARTKGRRPVLLSLSDEQLCIIGLRITRTHFSAGIYGLTGVCHHARELEYQPDADVQEHLRAIVTLLRELIATQGRRLLGIGVTMPGPLLTGGEIPTPIPNFAGWETVSVRRCLQEAFAVPVLVEQDANAAALDEWYQRADYEQTMLYLDMGQGVGAGLILDGRLFRGARGGAGEVGHMCVEANGPLCACGARGCLEGRCSSLLLLQTLSRAAPAAGEPRWTFARAVHAYQNGHGTVRRLVGEQAFYLGVAIGSLINLLSPNLVVIAGEFVAFGAEYLAEVIQSAKQHSLAALFEGVRIEYPQRQGGTHAFAGANLVLHQLLQDPAFFAGGLQNE